MNKKGSMDNVGILVGGFMVILVGLILFTPIANQVASTTDAEREIVNATTTIPSTTNETLNLLGRAFVGTPRVIDPGGDNTTDYTTNFTFTSNNLISGALEATISCNEDDNCNSSWLGDEVQISYTYTPDDYIPDAGGRSLALLIVIFTAIAIFVVSVIPVARQGLMNMFGR